MGTALLTHTEHRDTFARNLITMEIRRYLPGEEPSIWEVYYRATRESNSRDYHPDLIARWAPDDQDETEWSHRLREKNPFVAILEEGIVGMAEVDSNGWIDYFYVDPSFQGRGVGKALMARILGEAEAQEVDQLRADVSLTARTFFESQGFQVTEARSNVILGHPAPNFAMSRNLRCE